MNRYFIGALLTLSLSGMAQSIATLPLTLDPIASESVHDEDKYFAQDDSTNVRTGWVYNRDLMFDEVSITGGPGVDNAFDTFRISFNWLAYRSTLFKKRLLMTTDLVMTYSNMQGQVKDPVQVDTRVVNQERRVHDYGLTPLFRFTPQSVNWLLVPYVEAAVGFHYFSKKAVGGRPLGTKFQFGDHFGVGLSFRQQPDLRLTYRIQHFSNGGIHGPNPGVNFHLLSVGFRFKN